MDDIKFMTGYHIEPVVASEIGVTEAIQKYYPYGAKAAGPVATSGPSTLEIASKGLEELQASLDDASDVEVLEELQEISAEALARQGEEAPVVRLVNVVLMSAIQKGASDIHIEPYEKELRVRYRIDGTLYNIMSPPMKFRDAIASRIKIMSKLDIAEKRLPQDGRIKIRFNEQPQGDRLPRLGAAHALRREDRDAVARQGQTDARPDKARVRAALAGQIRVGDPPSVGHGPGHGADGQRQDEHPVFLDRENQHG
jgi:type II secretory ATPase GspE/PulE/Tfp pilus assembly ATPase PilB-like protein